MRKWEKKKFRSDADATRGSHNQLNAQNNHNNHNNHNTYHNQKKKRRMAGHTQLCHN